MSSVKYHEKSQILKKEEEPFMKAFWSLNSYYTQKNYCTLAQYFTRLG